MRAVIIVGADHAIAPVRDVRKGGLWMDTASEWPTRRDCSIADLMWYFQAAKWRQRDARINDFRVHRLQVSKSRSAMNTPQVLERSFACSSYLRRRIVQSPPCLINCLCQYTSTTIDSGLHTSHEGTYVARVETHTRDPEAASSDPPRLDTPACMCFCSPSSKLAIRDCSGL